MHSHVAASRPEHRRPLSTTSTSSMGDSMMTSLTDQRAPGNSSRPYSAMSSYATASESGWANQPSNARSSSLVGNSTVSTVSAFPPHRPPNSLRPRQSTAGFIAASGARNNHTSDEDGFCQIPIPGLGRGRRKPVE